MILYAGPFWGEFGWELMWQAYVREYAKRFTRTVVGVQPGHFEFYRDFADEFIPSPAPPGTHPDGIYRFDKNKVKVPMPKPPKAVGDCGWLNPYDIPYKEDRGVPIIPGNKDFISFERTPDDPVPHKVVAHARRSDRCPDRNWPRRKWEEFAGQFNVAFIGSPKHSYCPPNGSDLRGATLGYVMKIITGSRVVVGGSSGPMHLANLCKRPVVTWSGNAHKDKLRYAEVWNIFSMPNKFVASTWDPKLEDVCKAALSML